LVELLNLLERQLSFAERSHQALEGLLEGMGSLGSLALHLLRSQLFDFELKHLLGIFQVDDLLLLQVALHSLRRILLRLR